MKKTTLLFILVMILSVSFVFGQCLTPNTTSRSITADTIICSGTYNVSGVATRWAKIDANNVKVTCNNTIIIGNTSSFGIQAQVKTNVSIQDCTLQGFSYGIYYQTVNNSYVRNNTLIDNNFAIVLTTGVNNDFYWNSVNNTRWITGSHGIMLYTNAYQNRVYQNYVNRLQFGLLVETNSSYNNYYNNTVEATDIPWYSLHNATDNIAENNTFTCRNNNNVANMGSATLFDIVLNETHKNNVYNKGNCTQMINLVDVASLKITKIAQPNTTIYANGNVTSFSLANGLTTPYNDIKNRSNGVLLKERADSYDITLSPTQAIEIGQFQLENLTSSYALSGCVATLGNVSLDGTQVYFNYTKTSTNFGLANNITQDGLLSMSTLASWQTVWAVIIASAITLGVILAFVDWRG